MSTQSKHFLYLGNQFNWWHLISIAFVIIILWELLSVTFGNAHFPNLRSVIYNFFTTIWSSNIIRSQGGGENGFSIHVLHTFMRHIFGVIFGFIAGIGLALIVYSRKSIDQTLSVMIEIFRVIPPLIFIPILLVILGPIPEAQYIIPLLYSFIAMWTYTRMAMSHSNFNYENIALLNKATKLQIVLTIKLPEALPELVSGLRVSSVITLGIIIVSEYMGAATGLGRVLKYSVSVASIDHIFVGVFWAILLGAFVDLIIICSLYRFLAWKPHTPS